VEPLAAILGVSGWLLAAIWSWRAAKGMFVYRRYPRVAARPAPPGAGAASILVPARNEEGNIEACIESLLAQDHPDFEVIAIDDNSTDRTGELIARLAGRDGRLAALKATATPDGWTGKNWALSQAAARARGEWLLFTDADTRHGPRALSSAVAHAAERRLDILSLCPRALAGTLWERVLQPAAMGYLARWFPLERINDPSNRLAFANGQFLLFRRAAYEALGGHAGVRGEFLEDVAFARAAKKRGLRVENALGKRLFGVRMYDSLPRWFRGWRRIYLHAFDRKPAILLMKALDLLFLSALPLVFVVVLGALAAGAGTMSWPLGLAVAPNALALGLVLVFGAKVHSAVGETWRSSLLHPLVAALLAVVLLDATRAAWTGAPTRWR